MKWKIQTEKVSNTFKVLLNSFSDRHYLHAPSDGALTVSIKHGWQEPNIHLFEVSWTGFGWPSSWTLLRHLDLPPKSSKWFHQKSFFVIGTGKCWQSLIITVAFLVSYFPCEIVTSSNETWCIWNCFTARLISMETFLWKPTNELPFF